jgi:hypothetical protein
MQAGDILTISTIEGEKHATLLRNAQEYNVLLAITEDSEWFDLVPGDNIISIYGASAPSYFEGITLNLSFHHAYMGV